jgi:hypothetical protein
MRTTRSLLPVIFIALLLAACTGGRQRYERVLQRAHEQNQAYDSISNIDSLRLAAEYFDRHGSANERMRAHYLLGCAYRDMGDAPRALEAYHDAADRADTTSNDCDYALLCRVHSQAYSLLHYQELLQEEVKEQKLAIKYAWQANDTAAALAMMSFTPSRFFKIHDYDSTLIVSLNNFHIFNHYHDTLSANTALAPAIYVYLLRGQYSQAQPFIEKYEFHSHLTNAKPFQNPDYYLLYYYKGLYYLGINRLDSASVYFRKLMVEGDTPDNIILAQRGLHDLYMRMNQMDSVVKYGDLSYNMMDSLIHTLTSTNLQRMEAMYDYSSYRRTAEKEALKSNTLRVKLAVISSALILLLFISAFISYILHVRSRRKINRMASEYAMELLNYQSIKSKLNFLSKEKTKDNELIEDLKEELEKLRLSIKNKQTDQQSPDEWNIGDDLYESAIIKMFHSKAAYGGVITDAEWMDLRQLVNLYMPNFMEYIESFDYPFSLKQTNVLILTKLRFSPSELCNILQMNPSSVSNMRKRMYQKMFHKEGGAIDFDNVIRQAPC